MGHKESNLGAQWLSGRVLDSRPKGRGFEPHRRHCVVSLSKNINPSLVLVQPRKTRPFITERLLMGRKESNQTNKQTNKKNQIKPFPNFIYGLLPSNSNSSLNMGFVVRTITCNKMTVKMAAACQFASKFHI